MHFIRLILNQKFVTITSIQNALDFHPHKKKDCTVVDLISYFLALIYPFTHQHSIRSTGVNRYILYDNGNWSSQYIGVNLSRAVEYVIDTTLMTVQKIWEFSHPDSLYAPSTGCVQRLPNGNTFINWGNLGSSV